MEAIGFVVNDISELVVQRDESLRCTCIFILYEVFGLKPV